MIFLYSKEYKSKKMCGIFALLGGAEISPEILESFKSIVHRGPDNSKTSQYKDVFLGFHRLAINGLDEASDQPMQIGEVVLCCNGEIYNYQELAKEYSIELQTHSDCEIIIHLYKMFGIEKTCQLLDGEFSFILYDQGIHEVYVARDLLGLRGLFMGDGKAIASEAKALNFCYQVISFPPRSYWQWSTQKFSSYYEFRSYPIGQSEEEICLKINQLFTRSIESRINMSDRPVGFLLSGGLDSSLCVALAVKHFGDPKKVHTFSIGMTGSPDLKFAKIVADFLGTTHHEVVYPESEYLSHLEETVSIVESYDVTTIRASNGHQLIAKYISEQTDIKVVISGEVSDELTCGYMAFGAIEKEDELTEESLRMLNNIHLYDTLRSDRSIAHYGLEGRYPFASKDFLEFYLNIPASLKTFFNKSRIEKYLLRTAFDGQGLLPETVLWRRKDGFSDGVSDHTRPTRVIISEYIDSLVSDEEYTAEKDRFFPVPATKEAYYYRKIFEKYYPYRGNLIPGQWLPNPKYYGKITEPSGRILATF